jgi:hypothetical protein
MTKTKANGEEEEEEEEEIARVVTLTQLRGRTLKQILPNVRKS